ncbi:ABC transporter permease [Xanthocytophaga agilis]|nr:ABC transporter permease [Xanthocytophaga agilis]
MNILFIDDYTQSTNNQPITNKARVLAKDLSNNFNQFLSIHHLWMRLTIKQFRKYHLAISKYSIHFTFTTMLRNYLKIAFRSLVRNKAYSAINILGLAFGLACSLMIALWVKDELDMDAFHANESQLYQVFERQYYVDKTEASYLTQGLLAEELKKVIPEIQSATGMEEVRTFTLESGNTIQKMEGSFAGSDFFSMFSYPLLQGTIVSALNDPGSIAISRRMAEQFFGNPEQAIGKPIRFENKEDLLVTAVFENIPSQSSIQFDFLRSWTAYIKENKWVHNWTNTSPSTFIQLRPEIDPDKVETKIKDFVYQYTEKRKGLRVELGLQPYSERYLHSVFKNGQLNGGRIEYVRIFSFVAFFILLIACINLMNLATARSAKRAKEVGIRKVIGALRPSLIIQFLSESMVLTITAGVLALFLVMILLPVFSTLTSKHLSLPLAQPLFWTTLLGVIFITGAIAGSYPALFLSSFNPVRVLKGTLKFDTGSFLFRKGLVVFQFTLSILLIIGMIVMHRQLNYIQHLNLGYDRENLLYIPMEGELIQKYDLFKTEASKLPGILSISRMHQSPTVMEHHTTDISWPGKDPNLTIPFSDTPVGYDFVETMKLQLKEGRDFSKDFGTDSVSYLINETALQKLGYQNPIGQPLWWGSHKGTIIGVLKDFHFNSVYQTIDPLVMRLDKHMRWGTILIRVEAGKTPDVLTGLEKLHKSLNTNFPFTYQFSDQEYTNLYKSEQIVSKLGNCFSFLAIFISCLGLFGLAAYTAESKIKEISIRKVLGASVRTIVIMLSLDFVLLVGIAFAIAIPIAWYSVHQWLQNFAYHISVQWWIFALAGLLALVIAVVTISLQSVKAALANPVKALKTE